MITYIKYYGALMLKMQLTVDKAYSFSVFIGGHQRFSPLCLTTADRAEAVRRWNDVRDLALLGLSAEKIAAIVFATKC